MEQALEEALPLFLQTAWVPRTFWACSHAKVRAW
jgi:hypothetical protein